MLVTRRGIAPVMRLMAIALVGARMDAQPVGPRLAAPVLGWVASADSSQVLQIAGLSDSPRAGITVNAGAIVRAVWSAPDGRSALTLLAGEQPGVYGVALDGTLRQLLPVSIDSDVSVAWDRHSAGFGICSDTRCELRDASGNVTNTWDLELPSRVLAASATDGLLLSDGNRATWLRGSETEDVGPSPRLAAFRPGLPELWLVGDQITSRTWHQGATSVDGLGNATGLGFSTDGTRLFVAAADGNALILDLRSRELTRLTLDGPTAGVWPVPGEFCFRLQDSAKQAIGLWDGATGVVGWMAIDASAAAGQAVSFEVRP